MGGRTANRQPPTLRIARRVWQYLHQLMAKLGDRRVGSWAWVVVAVAVAWNLVNLRAVTLRVPYLNDSSVHEQMVRFATQQMREGHFPLTDWFPYLGLGSPQFLHYQSLPAMLTGAAGLVVGPDTAFRWSLYILLSVWPVSVYLAARLFGAPRGAAAASAAMSPFLSSAIGVGYEQKAYLWTGFGVWAQLWASLTLPLAWGLSWRAIRDRRGLFPAVVLNALTIALHFETGYLALLPLILWPLVSIAQLKQRLVRALVVLLGSLAACSWIIVPLIEDRAWAATNEILRGTPLVNGYGAGRVVGWLVSGQLLDAGRIPVLTVLAGIGLLVTGARWRRAEDSRALLVLCLGCLLLSFGRTTFGSLIDLVPGSGDLFFRRFMMGLQLGLLLLAGSGLTWVLHSIGHAARKSLRRTGHIRLVTGPWAAIAAAVISVVVLAPAWLQTQAYDSRNASAVKAQQVLGKSDTAQVNRLIAVIKRRGGGRTYAGKPTNWGKDFTVGAVPVFKYLEDEDVDEVGYTLRTASLMTDPEYYFDQRNPSDYILFGVHYLILPFGYSPPVPADLVMRAGQYCLWTLKPRGYVHVGRIIGTLSANRSNIGSRSKAFLRSQLAQSGDYLGVRYDVEQGARRTLPADIPSRPEGAVVAESDNLERGVVSARLRMRRPGTAILSVSFDPGWGVQIDGRAAHPRMISPALVGAQVPAGAHSVTFRYQGFPLYLPLFVLSAIGLLCPLAVDRLSQADSERRGAKRNPSD